MMKSPADQQAIGNMSKKMFPHQKNYLARCMAKASSILGPYAYLVVLCEIGNPLTDRFRVCSNPFQLQNLPTIYFPNPM